MRNSLLLFSTLIIFSCDHDVLQEKLETYDLQLKVDSFISVYEEAARIKDTPVPIRITLAGNGSPYDNQYEIKMNSELVIKGLTDKEYTIFANAYIDGALYYKEVKFNPAKTPILNLTLEGIVTRFKITPTSWPEGCGKVDVNVNFNWVTMIDETAYILNKLFTGGAQHKYILIADTAPEYYYATPFGTWSLEVVMYDKVGGEMFRTEERFEKFFEKLKSYNIKLDLVGLKDKSISLSFSLENLEFNEVELKL
jgi:hypothetical protein